MLVRQTPSSALPEPLCDQPMMSCSSPDLSLTPPSPESSPHRRPQPKMLVSGSHPISPSSSKESFPPLDQLAPGVNNTADRRDDPFTPPSSSISAASPSLWSSSTPSFYPAMQPFPSGPAPTLKMLFSSLRSLRTRLDALDLSSPLEMTRAACEELYAEVTQLDWVTTGPKWKNWRRERLQFGDRLAMIWGRKEGEDLGPWLEKGETTASGAVHGMLEAVMEEEGGPEDMIVVGLSEELVKEGRRSSSGSSSSSSEDTSTAFGSAHEHHQDVEYPYQHAQHSYPPSLSPTLSMSPTSSLGSLPNTPALGLFVDSDATPRKRKVDVRARHHDGDFAALEVDRR